MLLSIVGVEIGRSLIAEEEVLLDAVSRAGSTYL
jgi:hypothetical protein